MQRRPVRSTTHARIHALLLIVLAAAVTVSPAPAGDSGSPRGIGALVWNTPDGPIDLPILRIDLELDVHGIVAHATLVEEFTNPTGEVLEAEYVLPLPEHGVVHAMEMRIGERRIVSQVRERAQARAAYATARAEGQKAALVEQQRPNLFTTAVTGILPGETVVVRIEILDRVEYVDGEFRLVFPLTYTPRYGAMDGGSTSLTPPALTAPAPRVAIRATIDAGFPSPSIRSPSHVLRSVPDGRSTHVEPIGNPVLADRDFVLRFVPEKPPGPTGTLFVEDRPEGRYALVMLLPPTPEEALRGLATDTLFVVDVSGSMEGPSLVAAQEALLAALDRLRPEDTFNLLKFSNISESFRAEAQAADGEPLEAAREWVRALRASGGTELVPALTRALEMTARGDSGRARRVVVVTDGAVSNEQEAFAAVAARLGETRLHVIGIGSAPNRHLLRKLARAGRGTCEFLSTASVAAERIDAHFGRIDRPVLSDVALAWEGALPVDSFPERIPDLYSGEPLFVSVRLGLDHPGARLVLTGRDERGPFRETLEIGASAPAGSGMAIAWARAKIDALLEQLDEGADQEQVRADVIDIALQFGLATKYTSLVAVEQLPTVAATPHSIRVGSAPPGGAEAELGMLPQGGTLDPLFLRAGVVLLLVGGVFLALARKGIR